MPAGRVGRVVFGLLVAVASTLLMAPQTNEFGTKVGAAGRPGRRLRRPPAPRPARCPSRARRPTTSAGSRRGCAGRRRRSRGRRGARPGRAHRSPRCSSSGSASWRPARRLAGSSLPTRPRSSTACRTRSIRPRSRRSPSARTSPTATTRSTRPGAQQILLTLAENLELENQALLRARSRASSTAVDHGDRLDGDAGPARRRGRERDDDRRPHYHFDAVNVSLLVPFGVQTGAEPRLRLARHGHRGDLRRGRSAQSTGRRRRSRRPSPSAGRRAVAGSTSRSCRPAPAADSRGAAPARGPRRLRPPAPPRPSPCP